MPHWQAGGRIYFITFKTIDRKLLPDEARREVLRTALFDDNRRYDLLLATAMPDHVHLLLRPKEVSEGRFLALEEITKPLKGVSARNINKLLGRSGSLWQDESNDRIIRGPRELKTKWRYTYWNPVRAGLCERPEDYPFTAEGRPEIVSHYVHFYMDP